MGAATTSGNLSEAALPFDERREGLILGSAAVGIVLEKQELVKNRGMDPIASIEAGIAANSAFHGTRLDVDHISSVMARMIGRWEEQTGLSRDDLAKDMFFMSHETYSPKRGGSAAAEVQALRKTFGDKALIIPITNTKGFTGHTMGVGVEDVVAMRCLQKGILPPIANLKHPDPEFADLNLSLGGPCKANYVLRLAAGFGSQIVMALYKIVSREENRISDLLRHRNWLKEVTAYVDPVVSVEDRTLRVSERPAVKAEAAESSAGDTPVRAGAEPAEVAAATMTAEESIREKILALLSDKTGYPADMLDIELDLEADLGIDTVKQAEFISEVRQAFNIPRIEGLKIADFPTIRHIIHFVLEKSGGAPETPEVAAAGDAGAGKGVERRPAAEDRIHVFETRLVSLPAPKTLSLVEADEVLIFGGPEVLVAEVKKELRVAGYQAIRRISEPALPKEVAGKRTGIINLFSMEKVPRDVKSTFELYLGCASIFPTGPSFLVAAVSEDGAYGFESPGKDAHIAGGVAGATKAFAREYPDARVRVLDLHPEMDLTKRAWMIARSLTEAFPTETAVGMSEDLRVVRLVPSAELMDGPGIRPEDVVLVSGGARGITAACMRYLAEQSSLTFVILGRTPLTARSEQLAKFGPEQWEEEKQRVIDRMKRGGAPLTPVTVEKELSHLQSEAEVFRAILDLRSSGSEVIYRSVDIQNADGVDRVVQEVGELCGRVDLLVHAAGIDVSRSLKSKSLDQMESVFSVKVKGMVNLLRSLEHHGLPPRRIIGFGSVSGRFGNAAQVDYSAANDGLAHLLRRADRELDAKVSVIDWAPWAEIGMAVRGSVQQTLEAAGIDFIPPHKGVEVFAAELARSSGPCEVVAAGRLGPFASDAFDLPAAEGLDDAVFAGQKARILSILPGEYLKAAITLDPAHPLLDHHRIDRAAVLPGVGGMEIMRSAAVFLDPEANDLSFEDVHFHSPLKIFKEDPFEAEVEIIRQPVSSGGANLYSARISSSLADKEGHKVGSPRLHHECWLRSGSKDSAPFKGLEDWNRRVRITEDDLYSIFFHGPGFRFLDQVLVDGGGRGVRFRYRDTAERNKMFSDPIPAALEAAFQAAAAFGVEARSIMALPIGIVKVAVHSNDSKPAVGEIVLSGEKAPKGAEGRQVLTFDGVVRDDKGAAIVTLRGIRMMELDRSQSFPGRIFEEIIVAQEIATAMAQQPEALLAETLTEDEAREFEAKTVPKRAEEWIAGRVALKRSVQRLIAGSGREVPSGPCITVTYDNLGKPVAELSNGTGSIGHVSLSHSNGFAIAAASDIERFDALGVDIEKVEPRSESWVNDYFTDEEIRAAGKGDSRWHEFTRMWCLKEAVLKAMGTGLRFDLKEIDASSVDSTGRARLNFRGDAASHLRENAAGIVEARVEEQNDIVIATAVIRKKTDQQESPAHN
jgi:phosphopantetheine--protein transferase-like protein